MSHQPQCSNNSTIPSSLNNKPSSSYTPLSVVDFPLKKSKWCCKCPHGPPSIDNDNIVACSICNNTWGCWECHGIDQSSNVETKDEIVVCFLCANDNENDSSSNENEDSDAKQSKIKSDSDLMTTPTPETPKNDEVPIFKIIIENGQPQCNICKRKFKNQHLSKTNEKTHKQSRLHQKALKRLKSKKNNESIQNQFNHSAQPSQPSQPLQPSKPSQPSQPSEPSKPTSYMVQPKQSNTVIIFDFDDTLFPTTKLRQILTRPNTVRAQMLLSLLTTEEAQELINLSHVTYSLLLLYIARYSKRNICIVTASHEPWVKHVLSMVYNIGCYAQIYHLLFDKDSKDIDNNISIYYPSSNEFISFVSICQDIALHPQSLWKYKMFEQIFSQKAKISESLVKNTFVIIGDSYFEYEAAKKLSKYVEDNYGESNESIFIDRIKLMHRSTIDTLIKEQNVLFHLCQKQSYQKCSLLNKSGFDLHFKSGTYFLNQQN